MTLGSFRYDKTQHQERLEALTQTRDGLRVVAAEKAAIGPPPARRAAVVLSTAARLRSSDCGVVRGARRG